MKASSPLRILALAVTSLLATSAAQAVQLYYTNFDEFDPNFALSQQNFWTSNDPYNPAGAGGLGTGQSDLISNVVGYSTSPSDYLAVVGGLSPYFPGKRNVAVWKPLPDASDLSVPNITADGTPGRTVYEFKSTFAITGSPSDLYHDTFGFGFRDGSDNTKFKITFNYDAPSNRLIIKYVNAANTATTLTALSLGTNSTYKLQLDIDSTYAPGSDALSLSFTDLFGNSTSALINFSIPDGTASQIREAALLWDINDATVDGDGAPLHYGPNSLLVQNLEVDVVPEPVSVAWLLGGVLLPLFGLRRRLA